MMELLNVLKVVSYIVWSLVGLTTIGATIWGIIFYQKWNTKIMSNIFEETKEEAEIKRVK